MIESAAKKSDSVCFTGGGEPTILKNIFKFIRYAKKLGIRRVGLETNGMILSYKKYVLKLKESGLDYCIVSLHSHKEKISDKITRVEGGFKWTIEGLKNLIKEGIEIVSILHTINKLNYTEITEFISFMNESFGVRNFDLSFIRPIEDEESKEITPSLTEVKKYLHDALEFCKGHSINASMSISYGVPLCFMGGFENYSNELLVYVNQGRGEHIKQSHADQKIKSDCCCDCAFDECCSGIPKNYAEIYGTDELNPQKVDLNKLIESIKDG